MIVPLSAPARAGDTIGLLAAGFGLGVLVDSGEGVAVKPPLGLTLEGFAVRLGEEVTVSSVVGLGLLAREADLSSLLPAGGA